MERLARVDLKKKRGVILCCAVGFICFIFWMHDAFVNYDYYMQYEHGPCTVLKRSVCASNDGYYYKVRTPTNITKSIWTCTSTYVEIHNKVSCYYYENDVRYYMESATVPLVMWLIIGNTYLLICIVLCVLFCIAKLRYSYLKCREKRNIDKYSSCVVCLDNPQSVLFKPCGHNVVCSGCGVQLKLCPICKSRIKRKKTNVFTDEDYIKN